MSAWLNDETTLRTGAAPHRGVDIFALLRDGADNRAARVTASGAAWLAGASAYPRSTLSQWEARPGSPGVLPCGSSFDIVNVPALFGRRMLEQLWAEGPGSGPVATHRGRMLLFAAPGTAQRLPSLLAWEEWGTGSAG
ncbi:bifunctional DNA primase/polymerase, partial [Streptomyces sp. NRRL S-15]